MLLLPRQGHRGRGRLRVLPQVQGLVLWLRPVRKALPTQCAVSAMTEVATTCEHCGRALVDHNLIDMITCVYSGETVDGRPFNRNDAAKVVMKAAERLSR